MTPKDVDITRLLAGAAEAISSNMYLGMTLRSWRHQLRLLGNPISSTKSSILEIAEYQTVKSFEQQFKEFKFPSIRTVTSADGKPDLKKVAELRLALATKPIRMMNIRKSEMPDIRDLRATEFHVSTDGRDGRIVFDDANQNYSSIAYEPSKLFLSIAADSEGQEGNTDVIIAYPHLNPDNTIESVSIILMSKEQRQKALNHLLSHPKILPQIT